MGNHLPLYVVIILSIFLNAVLIGWPYCHIKLVFPLFSGVLPKKQHKRTLVKYKEEWGKWERYFLLPLLDKRSYKIYRVWFVLYILHIVNLLIFTLFEVFRPYFKLLPFWESYKREIEIILATLCFALICTLEGIALEIPHRYSKPSPKNSIRGIFTLAIFVLVILVFFIVSIVTYKTFNLF